MASSDDETSDSFCVSVQVVDNTRAAFQQAVRSAKRDDLALLVEAPKPQKVFDKAAGDLNVSLSECSTGWSLRSSKSKSSIPWDVVWKGCSDVRKGNPDGLVSFTLQHVDPTVRGFSVKILTVQGQHSETQQSFLVHVNIGGLTGIMTATMGSNASSQSPLDRRRQQLQPRARHNSHNSGQAFNGSGGGSAGSDSSGGKVRFGLPSNLKFRLCKAFDSPPAKGLNDWRALAAGLRLEKFTPYFASRKSPTECILNLWEVQQQASYNPLGDLLTLLRVIGRNDVVTMIEQDVGLWA